MFKLSALHFIKILKNTFTHRKIHIFWSSKNILLQKLSVLSCWIVDWTSTAQLFLLFYFVFVNLEHDHLVVNLEYEHLIKISKYEQAHDFLKYDLWFNNLGM